MTEQPHEHRDTAAGRAARAVRAELSRRGDVLLVISLGGVLGSLTRWGLGRVVTAGPGRLPTATLIVNLTGCLMIGALLVVVGRLDPPSRYLRAAVGTGFLGGLTTFSALAVDVRRLSADGALGLALGYLTLTLAGGLLAVAGADRVTTRWFDRRERAGPASG